MIAPLGMTGTLGMKCERGTIVHTFHTKSTSHTHGLISRVLPLGHEMCGVLLTNRNPVTNETILDGWAESTSHDTECVTGTPCPTSVKNISFVTEWLRLGRGPRPNHSIPTVA
jgi:hypothetical protein